LCNFIKIPNQQKATDFTPTARTVLMNIRYVCIYYRLMDMDCRKQDEGWAHPC